MSSGAGPRTFTPSRSRRQLFERILCCIFSFCSAILVPENVRVQGRGKIGLRGGGVVGAPRRRGGGGGGLAMGLL